MSVKVLSKRVERILNKLKPAPKLIHCAGEAAKLIAMLEAQIKRDEEDGIFEEVTWTDEDEALAKELSAMMTEKIRYIEETCNVKFVD